ncbi:MAG: formylmethanofuran dehydrogenase subunit E family protein [Candidatus Bathyarchaeia archaeon]
MSEESDETINTLLEDAVRFHGHLGPFLILGLKAGLLANKVLGKDYFKTKVTIETRLKPPYSCFIDGIQVATGCTMGKMNIEVRDGDPISVKFTKDNKTLEVKVKREVLKNLEDMRTEEDAKRKAIEVMRKSSNELFEIVDL